MTAMAASSVATRGLISLRDLDDNTFWRIVRRAAELRHSPAPAALDGRVVTIWFLRTSTRTRAAFTSGTLRLGGSVMTFSPGELQTNTGEDWLDTFRVIGSMSEVVVVRSGWSTGELRLAAASAGVPVVNAMATDEHPTQAITDVATLLGRDRDLNGLRVLYVGEGNNSATALALALTRVPGAQLTFATPAGYELPEPFVTDAAAIAARCGATVSHVTSLDDVTGDVDVVYTTRWQTTGTAKADPCWRDRFRPFHVDDRLMDRWPGAVFMHDLPAHRGEDVSGSVLDGPRSIAWEQARMKMYGAMAVLEAAVDATG